MKRTNRFGSSPPSPPGSSGEGRGGGDLLPDELLWAEGGHASDVVLTAIADGQSAIVPPAVRAHVERCSSCTTHLGHAALLSLHAGAELEAKAQHERLTQRRPLPRLAIALGLLVAVIGLLPSAIDADGAVASLRTLATNAPLFLHGLGTLAQRLDDPASAAVVVVTYATAAMLVVLGMAVARIVPKAQKETSR
jgi:hypothetical protein